MKNTILCLLATLFFLAGCKKKEDTERVKFARTTFFTAEKFDANPTITYGGKKYSTGDKIVTEYGDNRFKFSYQNGETVLDTVLHIADSKSYYVYQPDPAIPPILVTEIPEPPAEPGNPLNGEKAAPDGYMKIKMAYKAQFIFLNQSLDVVLYSTSAESPNDFIPIATLENIGLDYNTDFFLIKRPVMYDGSLSQIYKVSFVNSITKQPIMNKSGDLYKSDIPVLEPGKKNLFMIDVKDAKSTSRSYPSAILIDDIHYHITPIILWQRI